jgi:hypothetical protein
MCGFKSRWVHHFAGLRLIDFIVRMIAQYRAPEIQATEIEEQEVNVPARDASRLIRRGRSVNLAYGADGKMHLRRRARQIRRAFGGGVQWAAMPKADQQRYLKSRLRWPWWWI